MGSRWKEDFSGPIFLSLNFSVIIPYVSCICRILRNGLAAPVFRARGTYLSFGAFFTRSLGGFLERFQFRPEVFFGLFGHAVDEKDAVQVIALMLHGAAEQAATAELDE